MSEADEVVVCKACGREADEMGVLDSGHRVYIHGTSHCYAPLDDDGLLQPAVDQIRAHKKEST